MLFLHRALRAGRWGGVALAIGLGATAAALVTANRWYRSESVIAYARDVRVEAVVSGAEVESPRQIATRLQEMTSSRERLQKVIDAFGLYPDFVRERRAAEAVDEMRKHLTFSASDGFTFHLAFESGSRDRAQEVLTWFVNDVVEEDASARRREAESTKAFLDSEKREADRELQAREAALSAFLLRHPALAPESMSGASVGGVTRAENRAHAAANPAALAALQIQAQQLEDTLAALTTAPPVSAARPSPAEEEAASALSRADAALATARRELAEKRGAFTDEHPDVKAAERRVAEAEGKRDRASAAVGRLAPSVAEIEAAHDDPARSARAASLRRMLVLLRAQIADLGARAAPKPLPRQSSARPSRAGESSVAVDTEWTSLSRAVSEARERQSQLEERQLQANLFATLVSTGGAGRLIVVDPASKPMRPVAGRRATIALVGGAASLAAAMLLMLALAFLDQRLYWPSDVQTVFGELFVVRVPALPITQRERIRPYGVGSQTQAGGCPT